MGEAARQLVGARQQALGRGQAGGGVADRRGQRGEQATEVLAREGERFTDWLIHGQAGGDRGRQLADARGSNTGPNEARQHR